MKHYEYEINLFVDGELEKEKQSELFEHLAACKDCQTLFTDTLTLKEKTRLFCVENLNQIKNKPKPASKFYKIAFYTSSAAAVLLLFLLITAKPKETFITKNEIIVDTVFVEKEIPIAQNQLSKSSSLPPGKLEQLISQQMYLRYVQNLHTEKITDADLIETKSGS